ncbi:MAG: hypothetical protein A4S09_16340 [Proteobacteria bacterium SG_bin7]|nr:MAG: hypothetical protein A4S09_16340 [Proteobacteria bacterium SG_bin7]
MSLAPRIDRLDSNLLINGNFDFWQRGTSITPSGNQYLADRWQNHSGVTTNYSRQSGGPNLSSQFFARVTGPSGLIGLNQKVESVFSRYITEANLTFSFWAKVASGTSAVSVQVRTPSVVNNFTSSTLILNTVAGTATTSWQKFIFTVPVTNDMKSLGFMISVAVVGAVAATTLDVAQCVLLQGEIADPDFCLAGRSLLQEFRLCQRYYYVWGAVGIGGNKSPIFTAATTSQVRGALVLPVAPREGITPTVTSFDGSTSWTFRRTSDFAAVSANLTGFSAPAAADPNTFIVYLDASATPFVTNQMMFVEFARGLRFDFELY